MSLQGTLRTLGIAEVLEFLAGRGATGRLDISADSGTATYWMMRGEVAEVEFDFEREAGWDAAEATYYALAELDGTFHFDEDQKPEHGLETETVESVLSRTAVIADGWSDVETTIPSPDHWLTRSNSLGGAVTIEPAWWNAIEAIGAGGSARHLARDLDMRALGASTMAADMARHGLIDVGEPRVVEPLEPEPGAAQAIAEATTEVEAAESEPVESEAVDIFADVPAETVTQEALAPAAEIEAEPSAMVEADADAEIADPDPEAVAAALAEMSSWDLPGEVPDDEADVAWPATDDETSTGAALAWDETESVDQALPGPVETAPAPEHAPAETPEVSTPVADAQPGADELEDADDGWATDHSRPATKIAPAAAAPAPPPPTAEQLAAPPPMPRTEPDPAGLSDAPPAASVFEAAPPAGETFETPVLTYDDTPVPVPAEVDPVGDIRELLDDSEFGTDDRSSVLKFLRRD